MSAAFHLAGHGLRHRVLERLAHPGGHAITLEEDGYRFDRTGHLLHLRDPGMRELTLQWLGGRACKVQRRSVIWTHGVYTRYPFQANTQGLPPKVAYECLMGFLQAHYATHPSEPQNFEDFCLRHFGDGISRHFMIPYNCRLWGVHPREITAAWCSRFVPLPKLQDVVAGAVGVRDRELGYNTEFLYPRTGIVELPNAMAAGLPHIEYERVPVAIDPHRREVHLRDGATVGYSSLISTAPLDQLCALLSDLPDAPSRAASRLRCSALHYLDVALDVPLAKPVHWVYVPEERYPFYRVGCYSHFSEAMAPPGKACLYIELVDRREPDLQLVLPQVADALVEMGLIDNAGQIAFARKRKIDYAYVIFDHAYFASVETVQRFLRDHHILSTGRYGGWNYSSMEDALLFGRDAAKQVAELAR
jgi:protoporphyrinogen oxidase